MTQDLRTWSDEELCRACIPREWEDRLEYIGCMAAPLVSAIILFLWYLPWRKNAFFLEGVALWVLGAFLLFWAVQVISGWRFRRHKAELARRFGQREFDVYRQDARQEFTRAAADRIFLLQGRDLPGEQCAFVKITLLAAEPASGRLTVQIAPDFHRADFRTVFPALESHERELTQEEAALLLTERAESAESGLRDAPKIGKLYPCSVAVLERSGETAATCDLMSTPASEGDRSALDLVLRILRLAETVTDHPLVAGWDVPDEEWEQISLTFSVDGAERLFRRHDPPDWVVLFHGWALPYGGVHIIRVVLRETDPPLCRLWTKTRADKRSDPRDPRSALRCREMELSVAEWQSLLEGLRSITPGADLKLPRFPVCDGFPCGLIVLHRSPAEQTQAECNLAGLTESQAQEPLVKLMHTLLGLRQEAGAEAALYGACDTQGNIQIGEI